MSRLGNTPVRRLRIQRVSGKIRASSRRLLQFQNTISDFLVVRIFVAVGGTFAVDAPGAWVGEGFFDAFEIRSRRWKIEDGTHKKFAQAEQTFIHGSMDNTDKTVSGGLYNQVAIAPKSGRGSDMRTSYGEPKA